MDKKLLIEQLVQDAYDKGGFTGTWLYAEHGEIISKGARGFRDLENTLPIHEDSIFNLASISKQFTATAVMLLRRRGLLELDDEITKFFPQIPFPGVTIRHLLSHTGGLPLYEGWTTKTALLEHTIPDNDIIIRFLCESGLGAEFAPGEKFNYCNTGYSLLAEIIEKVSGVPFEDILAQEIFQPAGMPSTLLCHPRKEKITLENLARGLVLENGRYILPDGSKAHDYDVPLDGIHGKGNVRSNILDLFQWDRVLREERILTKEERQIMYTPVMLNNGQPAGGEKAPYGFGWRIYNNPALGLVVCHSGGWPGYITWYQRFVDADRVLIHLCCREPMDARVNTCFFEGMDAIASDREPKPIRTIEELSLPDPDKSGWEALCGKYSHPEDEKSFIDEILMRNGALYANLYQRNTFDGWIEQRRLYPLGEKQFGIKDRGDLLTFGDGTLCFDGNTQQRL